MQEWTRNELASVSLHTTKSFSQNRWSDGLAVRTNFIWGHWTLGHIYYVGFVDFGLVAFAICSFHSLILITPVPQESHSLCLNEIRSWRSSNFGNYRRRPYLPFSFSNSRSISLVHLRVPGLFHDKRAIETRQWHLKSS